MSAERTSLSSEIGAWLRAQPTLSGAAPRLDFASLPDDPVPLFIDWIRTAADANVPEPHAATLATIAGDGMPDARTLILKDVDERGWAFAGARSARKASQIETHAVAALNFWWQPLMRAVRVRGRVQEGSARESAADLAARSAAARVGTAPGEWVLWRIVPTRVEFWQGAADRDHSRIVYRCVENGWTRTVTGAGSSIRS